MTGQIEVRRHARVDDRRADSPRRGRQAQERATYLPLAPSRHDNPIGYKPPEQPSQRHAGSYEIKS